MNTLTAENIYRDISSLPNDEKIILLSKLMTDITAQISKEKKLNIYGIKGVGKELWQGIDAQEYVDKERATWER